MKIEKCLNNRSGQRQLKRLENPPQKVKDPKPRRRNLVYVDELKPCEKTNLLQVHEVDIHELKEMMKKMREELKALKE